MDNKIKCKNETKFPSLTTYCIPHLNNTIYLIWDVPYQSFKPPCSFVLCIVILRVDFYRQVQESVRCIWNYQPLSSSIKFFIYLLKDKKKIPKKLFWILIVIDSYLNIVNNYSPMTINQKEGILVLCTSSERRIENSPLRLLTWAMISKKM